MMKPRVKGVAAVVAVLGLALIGAGCSAPAAPSASVSTDPPQTSPEEVCELPVDGETVTITGSAWIEANAALLLGVETGAFERAGLDVVLERLPEADALPQIAQGRFDGMLTSLGAGHLNAIASGVDLKWVAPMYELPPRDVTEVVPGYWASKALVGDATDPDLSALVGESIGSPTGGTGAGGLVLDRALQAQGLGVDDISFTTLAGTDALIALENGAVAGAWLSAPFYLQAAQNPDLRLIAAYEPGINGSGLLVGPGLLERPAVLVKFVGVLSDMIDEHLRGDYHADDDVVAHLAAALEQDPQAITAGTPLAFDPALDMSGAGPYMEELQEFLAGDGNLDYDQLLVPEQVVNAEVVRQVAACRS